MSSSRYGLVCCLSLFLAGCEMGKSESDPSSVNEDQSDLPSSTTSQHPAPQEKWSYPKISSLPKAPVPRKEIKAKSILNQPAPKFVVDEWLTDAPNRQGKMVLIDFWATWCGPCLRSVPDLNTFHEKYQDRLVIIGVSNEPAEIVRGLRSPRMDYFVAVDPQARMYRELNITHIPHLIILDPDGFVRWEGNPLIAGHRLTEDVIEELLDTYVPVSSSGSD